MSFVTYMGNETSGKLQKPMSLEEAAQMRYFDPRKVRFVRHGSAMRFTIEGECSYPRVTILRVFPLSLPQRYLSVRDSANKEIGIVPDLAALDEENRNLVEEELTRRYFVPEIRRIIDVKEWFGTVDWQVETDRGVRRFTTRNLRENVLRPFPNRFILSDVDGNRYDVKDLSALDEPSRDWILKHI